MKKLKVNPKAFEKLIDISKKLTTANMYSMYATVGVLATTALAIICTRKQCEYENEIFPEGEISENVFEEDRKAVAKKMIKDTAINYVPVAASCAATLFFITRSNYKWMHYNGIINAAFISARDKMARYRTLASSAVAAEVVNGLGDRRSYEDVEWFCLKDLPTFSNGVPETKDLYFMSTRADVIEAEYHLNRNFALRGSASVREFCAFLGIIDQFPDELGDAYGWDVGVMMEDWGIEPWIDFEHSRVMNDEEPINLICFTWEPGFSEDYSPRAWGYGMGCGVDFKGLFPTE